MLCCLLLRPCCMLPTWTCGVVAAVQVDTVLSRLIALKERIEGTEALIEIDLDHRRNELVAFDLVRQLEACTQRHNAYADFRLDQSARSAQPAPGACLRGDQGSAAPLNERTVLC